MLARLTTKNQLTLPRDIVKEFQGIEYFDVAIADGRILLAPVRMQPLGVNPDGIRKKMEKLGIMPDDVTSAIRWAGKRSSACAGIRRMIHSCPAPWPQAPIA